MDAPAYSKLHWSFNMHICMFSPEVVNFFLFCFFFFFSLLCCYFSVECIIHVLHLTMFLCVGDVNKNRNCSLFIII